MPYGNPRAKRWKVLRLNECAYGVWYKIKKALPNDQSEKMDSLNNEPVAIQEEIVEVRSSHSENEKMEELSCQLEFAKQINRDLKQKIEKQTLLVNKTEIAFKAKEELVGAKN